MDDYRTLEGYGTTHGFSERAQSQDKGHEVLIRRFFEGLRAEKRKMPIDLKRLNQVSKLTLTIDQLVCQGGGNKELAAE